MNLLETLRNFFHKDIADPLHAEFEAIKDRLAAVEAKVGITHGAAATAAVSSNVPAPVPTGADAKISQ